jgi:thiol-disulfide isomerase/thioredoxin
MSNRFFKQGGYGKKYKQMVTDNDPKAYQLAYAAYNKLQTDALDSFMKAAKPPEFFEEWARSFVKYATLSKYYTYLFHKPRLSNSGTSYMAVDDSYYEFLNQVSMDVEPEIIHSSFNDFVYFYIVDYKARNLSGADDALLGSIEHAKTDLPETVGNMAIAHVVKDMIQTAASRNDYDRLRAILKDFENKPNTTKYAAFLDEKYKEKAVLAPGSPAPNFTLKDLDNNEVSLSDFKGSVVVLDFWGTWCGPCKRELPYSRKIEENFKDREDVVFLFVAMERGSRDYWKEFVNNNNLPGTHLYTSNDNRNLVPYKITSVPRYVLLDKEGNIYDAFASRPSQNMEVQIAKVLEL